jgi:S-methylmethionine-dependent homocysteine/selenocysteine methylase
MLVIDGAMGTMLAARGHRVDGPAFSAPAVFESPDAVSRLHAEYAAAGATVHTAATFRATPAALDAHARASGRPVPSAEAVVREAVSLARRAVPSTHRVAGSLASTADCYRPGEVARDARASHREQVRRLAAAGVDLILCETFADADEAAIALAEARATGLPVWVALTGGPDTELLQVADIRRAAERMVTGGASAVLINCTRAVSTGAFVRALSGLPVPFGAYANAGKPEDGLGWVPDWGVPPPSSKELAIMAFNYSKVAEEWVDNGATVLGGCCGTTPDHIAALSTRFGLSRGK